MYYYVSGECLAEPEIIDYRMALALAEIARHARLSRVKRKGRAKYRRWILKPRNKAEQFKRPGRLKK